MSNDLSGSEESENDGVPGRGDEDGADAAAAAEHAAPRETERGEGRGRRWRPAGRLLIGAIAAGAIFFYLQFSTDAILDVDGYYHIRWSRLLWEGMRAGVFPPPFPWLPLTTLNARDYVDHHLLFHILQIPFTWFGDIRLGAKVAAAGFGALAVLSCYWLVVRHRIHYSLVWLIALLACSAPFLYRLSMARAQSVSIIFMVAGIHLLFERRYRWLAPLAFLYVWTYSLFIMLCAAAVIWAGVVLWSERRVEWRPLVWTAAGTIAGFVLNPYFPRNVKLFVAHFAMKAKATEFTTSVGMEWYPYESWYFLGSSLVAFAAMLVGYIAFDWTDRRGAARPLFLLIFSTILLIMNARSRRFVEYWPPFAVLFAAFALQPIFEGARGVVNRLSSDILTELQPFLDRHERPATAEQTARRMRRRLTAAVVVALVLAVPLIANVRETARVIASDQPPTAYRGAMAWISRNVPKGEVIFNTDWDDFPKLFFYDTDHVYVSGLDPTYLLNQNPQLSELYVDVTLGRSDHAASIIRERFGARYVFSDTEEIHDDFYYKALDSGWFEEVYKDDYSFVLRILDERRAPPPEGGEPLDDVNGFDTGEGGSEQMPPQAEPDSDTDAETETETTEEGEATDEPPPPPN